MGPFQSKEPLATHPASQEASTSDQTTPGRPASAAKRDGLGLTSTERSAFLAQVRQTLLASARHELRSPIQSIQGFSELLNIGSHGPLSDDQRLFVGHILQGSADLTNALDMCFELAQLEVFGVTPKLERSEVQGALIDALEAEWERAPDAVRFDPADSPPLYANLDPALFRRAIGALLTALRPFGPTILSLQSQADAVLITFTPAHPFAPGLSADASDDTSLDVELLITQGRPAKGLLWLRLASLLLASQAGTLLVSPRQDRARVQLFPS